MLAGWSCNTETSCQDRAQLQHRSGVEQSRAVSLVWVGAELSWATQQPSVTLGLPGWSCLTGMLCHNWVVSLLSCLVVILFYIWAISQMNCFPWIKSLFLMKPQIGDSSWHWIVNNDLLTPFCDYSTPTTPQCLNSVLLHLFILSSWPCRLLVLSHN